MLPTCYVLSDVDAQKYFKIWDLLDDYVNQDIALTSIFKNYPLNVDVPEVLLKCSVLNSFYSAGILNIDLLKVAEVIVNCDIDNDLQSGNWNVVYRILKALNNAGIHNYYSFVSKYCNWHNQEKFPIYDSYVDNVVWHLKQNNCINSFKHRKDLEDYTTFGNALFEIYKNFSLTSAEILRKGEVDVNYKILDRYLWLLGKYHYADSNTSSVKDIVKAMKLVESNTYEAHYENYVITRSISGTIKVSENGSVATNTKDALRIISQTIGFKFDHNWNTRQFGKKVIEFINLKYYLV